MNEAPRRVVIALGNAYRGDDGAGLELLRRLRSDPPLGVELREAGGDPLALIDLWDGAALAVVLDSAVSGGTPGTLHRVEAAEGALAKDLGRCSTHGFGIGEAAELAGSLGRLPRRLVVYAIEGAAFGHGDGLSPVVEAGLDGALTRVRAEVATTAADEEEAVCTKRP